MNGSFAYDTLVAYMSKRALQEAGAALPTDFYLHDIDFDNIFEEEHIAVEQAWYKAHPEAGAFTNWVLIGSLLPPQYVNASERARLVANTTELYYVDQLPTRLSTVRNWLATQYDKPHVMFWHCEAGCDRTGEMSAAYYMTYQGYNVTGAFAKDTVDCGRPPNYFSAGAIEWYCLWLEAHHGADLGNCLSLPV